MDPFGSRAVELATVLHRQFDAHGTITRGADLSRLQLGSLRMPGALVDFVDCTATELCDSVLEGARISNAILTTADLNGSNLSEVRFENCSLRGADLAQSNLDGARFAGCDLRSCSFVGGSLRGTFFDSSCVTAAHFEDANLRGARFLDSTLNEASFAGADLYGALMPNCPVRFVTLDGTRSFAFIRELVSEVLLADAQDDVERERIALLVAYRREWCWPAWRELAADADPLLVGWAQRRFAAYPQSGMAEAFDGTLEKGGGAEP